MILLGGWQPAQAGDRDVATAMGISSDELRVMCAQLAAIPKAQFAHLPRYRNEQEMFRFRNQQAAFFSLAGLLDGNIVERFAQTFTDAAERALSLSQPLLQGLCCALACLGNSDGRLALEPPPSAQAAALVTALLSVPAHWTWFGSNLPLLAEAAPLAFLDRVEETLGAPEPPPSATSDPARTRLCQALATLAWAIDLLPRAALALATLVDAAEGEASDPAVRSLEAIFRHAAPQTSADIPERLRVLRLIKEQHPRCAWTLLLTLLPRPGFGGVLHESRRPSVLKLSLPRRWPRAYQGESYGQVQAFLELACDLADRDDARWAQLIGSLMALPQSLQDELLQRLQAVVEAFAGSGHATFAALRKTQPVLDLPADSGGAPELRPAVERLLLQLEPSDPVLRDGWLFVPGEWRFTGAGFAADSAEMARRQRQALAAMLPREDRWELLERLAHLLAQVPEHVAAFSTLGQLLAETPWADELAKRFLHGPVTSPLKELMPWFLAWRLVSWDWGDTEATVRGLVARGRSEDASALLLRLGGDGDREKKLWDLVDDMGDPLRTDFWQKVPVYVGSKRPAALQERFIRQILKQARWRDAAMAAVLSTALSFALRAELLSQIADECQREDQRQRAAWEALVSQGRTAEAVEKAFGNVSMATAYGSTVAKVLEAMAPHGDVEALKVGRLEASLLKVLRGTQYQPRFLPQQLSAHPEWFAHAVERRLGDLNTEVAEANPPPDFDAHDLAAVWSGYPGDTLPPDQRARFLERWCREVLRHCPRPDNEEHFLWALAPFLSRPKGADGIWPGDAARALLEDYLALGAYLSEGSDGRVTYYAREIGEGGGRERARAAARRRDAARLPRRFPRAKALLLHLAEVDERRADDEDTAAKAERWSEQMDPSQAWSGPLFPLRDVHIENVRSVRDLTVPLDPRLTVVSGRNASGKSTVLDSIAIGLARIADRLPRIDGQEDEDLPELTYRDLRKTWEGGKETPAAHARVTLSVQLRDERDDPLTWSAATRYAGGGPQVGDQESPQLGAYLEWLNEALRRNDEGVLMPVFAHYGVERAVSAQAKEDASPRQGGPRRREAGLDGALVGAARFDRAVAAFRQMEDIEARLPALPVGPGASQRKRELPALREVRTAIEQAVRTPHGWHCERPRIDVAASKFLIDLVHDDGRRQELQLAQLSDGFRTHLALVMDLALRMVQCNPPREEGAKDGLGIRSHAVALIDEVDLHLHPQWQRVVLDGLLQAFPNCQFVVTTHSPQVLAGVRDGIVYKLGEDQDGAPMLEPVRTYGKDSNATLTEDMDTGERPEEVKARLHEIHGLLDEDRYTEAEAAIRRLQEELGHDDAALVGLRTDLALLRADGDGES